MISITHLPKGISSKISRFVYTWTLFVDAKLNGKLYFLHTDTVNRHTAVNSDDSIHITMFYSRRHSTHYCSCSRHLLKNDGIWTGIGLRSFWVGSKNVPATILCILKCFTGIKSFTQEWVFFGFFHSKTTNKQEICRNQRILVGNEILN